MLKEKTNTINLKISVKRKCHKKKEREKVSFKYEFIK